MVRWNLHDRNRGNHNFLSILSGEGEIVRKIVREISGHLYSEMTETFTVFLGGGGKYLRFLRNSKAQTFLIYHKCL